MTQITATELKNNLGRYLDLAKKEEILITKNSAVVAILTSPKHGASLVDELTGVIPNDGASQTQIRKERRERYESNL